MNWIIVFAAFTVWHFWSASARFSFIYICTNTHCIQTSGLSNDTHTRTIKIHTCTHPFSQCQYKVKANTLLGIIDNEEAKGRSAAFAVSTLFWIHVATLAVIKKLKCNVILFYLLVYFEWPLFFTFDLQYTENKSKTNQKQERIFFEPTKIETVVMPDKKK